MSFTNCKPHNYRCNTIDDVAETCPYCEIDTLRKQLDNCEHDRTEAYTLITELRERIRELGADKEELQDCLKKAALEIDALKEELFDEPLREAVAKCRQFALQGFEYQKQIKKLEAKLTRYEQTLNKIAEHGGSDSCQCFRVARRVLKEDV